MLLQKESLKQPEQLNTEEHYKYLFERYYNESQKYQAMLFHSYQVIKAQSKGLARLTRLVKRLRAQILEVQIFINQNTFK